MPGDAAQHAGAPAKFGPVTITPKTPDQIDLSDFQPGDVVYIDTHILQGLGPYPMTKLVHDVAVAAGRRGIDWSLSEDHEHDRFRLELRKVRPI